MSTLTAAPVASRGFSEPIISRLQHIVVTCLFTSGLVEIQGLIIAELGGA